MSLTFRQIAQRENARRSTGPATPEGKAAARFNGLSHGLCLQQIVSLPGETPGWAEEVYQGLMEEHQPATPTQRQLVEAMAVAQVGMVRCRAAEQAALTNALLQADSRSELDEKVQVESLLKSLSAEPAVAVAALKQTLTGCRRLLEICETMRSTWSTPGARLTRDLFGWLLKLSGFVVFDGFRVERARRLLLCYVALTQPGAKTESEFDLYRLWSQLEVFAPSGCRPNVTTMTDRLRLLFQGMPTAEEAARELGTALGTLEEELSRRHAELEARREAEASSRVALALIDTSKEGQIRHRYYKSHERSYHQALTQLRREQKLASERPEESSSRPGPSTPPAAAPAPAAAAPAASRAATPPAAASSASAGASEPAAAPASAPSAAPAASAAGTASRARSEASSACTGSPACASTILPLPAADPAPPPVAASA